MGKIFKKITAFEMTLITIMVLMVSVVSYSVYNYVKLQQSWPLEDFTGYVVSPIDIAQDKVIVTDGTYSRSIQCDMYNFEVQLRNAVTKDIIILNKEHLAKAPKASMTPANDVNIEFELFIPGSLYEGWWSPTFEGHYWCKQGIFTANKIQTVPAAAFEVVDSSKQ